ncbi:MAG TPA: hypothetical protein VMR74_02355 [Gammaproteobacteria bacterium]|nr:hypothetical protein [Gammaproteobacteria bacterium]
MNTRVRVLVSVALISLSVPVAQAQLEVGGDLLDNCGQIDALQSAGNFSEARDKARLCLDGIERRLLGELGQYFPQQVGAWTRTGYEENQMFGFTNIAAEYEKDGVSVDVSLTGQAGGGDGGPLGGLGGLFGGIAQSALGSSGQQVTVAGLSSSVQPDGTLMVPLEDGSFLTFSSYEFDNPSDALAGMGDLVNDFPVAEINAALQ